MKKLWARGLHYYHKYEEAIVYLAFGVLATAVNIVVYGACANLLALSTFWSTSVAWVVSVLFAYFTNRTWVFKSRAAGAQAWREFWLFVGCRVFTYFIDVLFMELAVEWYGVRYIPVKYQPLWELGAKLASNVVVVVLNYVFSKLIIFKKKKS